MPRSRMLASAGIAALALAACRDVPAPEGGVYSISVLGLPSPGVVAGDTIRDSLGMAAPLELVAFGADNEPLDPQPERAFAVLDTGARIENRIWLIGEIPGTTVRVVGGVAGLQTTPVEVKVTLRPDSLVPADSVLHHVTYTFPADTAANAELNVTVRHHGAADTTGVDAVVVRYTVERAPAGSGTAPTLLLLNGSAVSDRDTTVAGGRASRSARLRIGALTSFVSDTVVVTARASHRGASIGAVAFTIVYRNSSPPVQP